MSLTAVTTSDAPTYGVVLTQGRVGLHSGVLFRAKNGPPQILHLSWHLRLGVDSPDGDAWWMVSPRLSRMQRAAVVAKAGQVAQRYQDGALAYGFDLDGVSVDADGCVDLGGGVGLTCATFVQILHAAAGAPLLAIDSWKTPTPARRAEDNRAQKVLVEALSANHPRQAERVRRQVGATRIRAEEVAAASGIDHRPAEYDAVAPVAKALATEVQTRAPFHPHARPDRPLR